MAAHLDDHFLVAAAIAWGEVGDIESPAVHFGVFAIHLVEIADEQTGLVAAGAGTEFEEKRFDRIVLGGEKLVLERLHHVRRFGFSLGQFGGGELGEIGVAVAPCSSRAIRRRHGRHRGRRGTAATTDSSWPDSLLMAIIRWGWAWTAGSLREVWSRIITARQFFELSDEGGGGGLHNNLQGAMLSHLGWGFQSELGFGRADSGRSGGHAPAG